MHGTPVSIASRKLCEQLGKGLGVADRRSAITPGGRFCRLGSACDGCLHRAERLAVQLDLEVDVAQRGRSGRSAPARWPARCVATLPSGTGPLAPGTRQALDQRQVLARRVGQLHDHRHLALRQVELGQALVVVARGGDAQRVGDRGRGDAQVGRARGVGPHDQLGPLQARGRRDLADAGDRAQFLLDHARVRRPARRRLRRPAPGCTSPPSRRSRR